MCQAEVEMGASSEKLSALLIFFSLEARSGVIVL
jgi:hypothetical protein